MTTARDNLARKQIFIPANVPEEEIVLRVAAYCRVSTDPMTKSTASLPRTATTWK